MPLLTAGGESDRVGSGAFGPREYWNANVQVDVVGVRQDNWTDLGECKWGEVASLSALAAELDEKVRCYANARNARIARRLFVRRAPAKARLTDVRVHTLQALHELETETQL
jgi:hypothetical protein